MKEKQKRKDKIKTNVTKEKYSNKSWLNKKVLVCDKMQNSTTINYV